MLPSRLWVLLVPTLAALDVPAVVVAARSLMDGDGRELAMVLMGYLGGWYEFYFRGEYSPLFFFHEMKIRYLRFCIKGQYQ